MAKAAIKATPLVLVRQLLRDKSREAEEAVVQHLTAEERHLFESFVATDWLPVPFASKVYDLGSRALYPGDPAPLRRMGREVSSANIRGVYRFMMRALSESFLLQQTARLWRTYHATGEARTERVSKNQVDLIVSDYPELTTAVREVVMGYLSDLVASAGAKDVRVTVRVDGSTSIWSIYWRTP
jgi:Protein of unknown function (DUF2378)